MAESFLLSVRDGEWLSKSILRSSYIETETEVGDALTTPEIKKGDQISSPLMSFLRFVTTFACFLSQTK